MEMDGARERDWAARPQRPVSVLAVGDAIASIVVEEARRIEAEWRAALAPLASQLQREAQLPINRIRKPGRHPRQQPAAPTPAVQETPLAEYLAMRSRARRESEPKKGIPR